MSLRIQLETCSEFSERTLYTITALTLFIGQRDFEIQSRKQQIGYMIDEEGKAITFLSLEEKRLVWL